MQRFVIELAGVKIAIHHRYDWVKYLCTDYICEDEVFPEFEVNISEKEIAAEQKSSGFLDAEASENVCIHRAVVKGLVKYGIILMHSAVVAVDGYAYVFMAKSGVGKSTHIQQWMTQFKDRAVIVNGDKPMFAFKKGDDGMECFYVYGSPWRGKEQLGENTSVPVKAICFLERGKNNRIAKATEVEVIERLFHQVLLPRDAGELSQFMDILNRIIKQIPFYRLACTISVDAAVTAYQGMNAACGEDFA